MNIVDKKNNIPGFKLNEVKSEKWSLLRKFLIVFAVVFISVHIGLENYLLFHLFIEILGMFIGFGVTLAVYHSCRIMKNGLYIYLATIFLVTSTIQAIHIFTYEGINVFESNTYDLSIQIAIMGKYIDVIALFVMLFIPANIIRKNLSIKKLIIPFGLITSAVLISIIYLEVLPQFALDNAQSTSFKIMSEYILLFSYIILLVLTFLKRRILQKDFFNYIFSYIALRLLSEVLFASSKQVNDLFSVLAHILWVSSLCVVYKAVSVWGINKPIAVLVDEIDKKNQELEKNAKELEVTNEKLRGEIEVSMRTEELLRKSEEKYRLLLDSMPDALVLHDRERIIFINQTGARLCGFENNLKIIEKNMQDIFDEKRYALFQTRMDEVDNSRSPVVYEETFLYNNERVYVEVVTTLHRFDNKPVFLSVVRDITQRKKFEEMKNSIDKSKKLLMKVRQRDKLRADYFTNLSHELRTPLSIILCNLKILESMYNCESNEEIDKEKLNKYVVSMQNNSYRLLKTANNLLDITKIEAGYDQLSIQNCNIVRVVEKVTMLVWEYTRNRRVSLMFDTDVEEIITACDMDKIERIILNLLSNAIKFTKEGGQIEVNIYNKYPEVLISVSDTGIGIPKDKLEMIFERFKQVDNSLSRTYEGTGIGLALVKSLVEMHDGRIEVESEVNKGSIFKIFLPIWVLRGEVCLNDDETVAEIEKNIGRNLDVELSNI